MENCLTIHINEPGLAKLVLNRLGSEPHQEAPAPVFPFIRIGSAWPGRGGVYAGIMRGRDGAPDYHLIVGPAIAATSWEKAKAEASEIEVDGHKDFSLPFRAEQALQYANVPELFEKEWYWSCEQHAASADYAWMQNFGDGVQSGDLKDINYRARAVRRLNIV